MLLKRCASHFQRDISGSNDSSKDIGDIKKMWLMSGWSNSKQYPVTRDGRQTAKFNL